VNASRTTAGLPTLRSERALTDLAQRQAERMRDAGDIFHNPHLADDVTATGLAWIVAGENVGMGPDVAHIENAFMRSAEHRRNILDGRYTAVGIGRASRGGETYIAQVFASTER
jgi:uncharacterized protein YkwD